MFKSFEQKLEIYSWTPGWELHIIGISGSPVSGINSTEMSAITLELTNKILASSAVNDIYMN
jgi:hypothetical protein